MYSRHLWRAKSKSMIRMSVQHLSVYRGRRDGERLPNYINDTGVHVYFWFKPTHMCIVEIIFNIYSYMSTSQFQYICVSSTDGATDGAYEIIYSYMNTLLISSIYVYRRQTERQTELTKLYKGCAMNIYVIWLMQHCSNMYEVLHTQYCTQVLQVLVFQCNATASTLE
jgi:hypothetical protein